MPEKIKRGLRCCANGCDGEEHCPYSGDYDCNWVLIEDALALVEQMDERCERLLRTAEMLNDALREYQRREEE